MYKRMCRVAIYSRKVCVYKSVQRIESRGGVEIERNRESQVINMNVWIQGR